MRLEYQIIVAVLLDLLLGDPRWFPHPVRGIGWLARVLGSLCKRIIPNAYTAGIMTALGVVFISGGVVYGLHCTATMWHPVLGDVTSILIIYFSIAARDLAGHALTVYGPLKRGELEDARNKVAMIVGRDTQTLDETGISRAAIESVAENLVDGVIAPLFFAILFGPVGAACYKAINTLDSTFGYKTPELIKFGWASARIDDLANWLPARLSAPVIALAAMLLGESPVRSLIVTLRDRKKHSSPNSGISEAAFAGALGIQLGGPTSYRGIVRDNPIIGNKDEELRMMHILSSVKLMLVSAIVFVVFGLGIRLACAPLV